MPIAFALERRTSPYVPGSIIVKFKDETTRSGIGAATAQVSGELADRSSWADFDIMAIPSDADPESAAAAMRQRAMSNTRNRATATMQCRARTTRSTQTSGTSRRSTWSERGTSSRAPRRASSSPSSIAAWRSGPDERYNSTFAFRLTPFGPLYPALGAGGCAGCRGARARPERIDALRVAARFHLERRNAGRSRRTRHSRRGHHRTAHEQNSGTAGMAYNVRLMPVKVIDGDWDYIFNSPFTGTDDVVARGVRYAADNGANVINLSIGRERRRPRNRGDRCDPLCRQPRLSSSWWPQATRARMATSRIGSRRPRRKSTAWSRSAPSGGRSICATIRRRPVCRTLRPGRRPAAGRHLRRHPAANARSRSARQLLTRVHRAPIRLRMNTSRAPRWRRRMSQASRRC